LYCLLPGWLGFCVVKGYVHLSTVSHLWMARRIPSVSHSDSQRSDEYKQLSPCSSHSSFHSKAASKPSSCASVEPPIQAVYRRFEGATCITTHQQPHASSAAAPEGAAGGGGDTFQRRDWGRRIAAESARHAPLSSVTGLSLPSSTSPRQT
jgi:hypothetical protein